MFRAPPPLRSPLRLRCGFPNAAARSPPACACVNGARDHGGRGRGHTRARARARPRQGGGRRAEARCARPCAALRCGGGGGERRDGRVEQRRAVHHAEVQGGRRWQRRVRQERAVQGLQVAGRRLPAAVRDDGGRRPHRCARAAATAAGAARRRRAAGDRQRGALPLRLGWAENVQRWERPAGPRASERTLRARAPGRTRSTAAGGTHATLRRARG